MYNTTIDEMVDIYTKMQNGSATLSDRLKYDVLRGAYGWSKETADFMAQIQMSVNDTKEKK